MTVGRRDFLAMPMLLLARPSTDVRIEEIQATFEDYRYRAPYRSAHSDGGLPTHAAKGQ